MGVGDVILFVEFQEFSCNPGAARSLDTSMRAAEPHLQPD